MSKIRIGRDPITFEVVRSALIAVAAEMKVAMMRTAYSPLIAVGGDLSTALADGRAEVVAQGQDIPVQLGAIPLSLRMTLSAYGPERLRDGDVLISNDPYLAGSNHLNDVCMVMPVFVEGKIFAYAVSRAHWTDIGGFSPGAFNTRMWDIYGEGLRIPAVLAYQNYEPVETTFNLILANVRGSVERVWDMRSQFGACLAGQRSIRRLCAKYGAETVAACMEEAKDYSERRLRARIAEIPDGTYRFHDYMEGDGWDERPIRIEAAITIRGSDVEVDFTGTDPQVRGGVNAPTSITEGVCLYALKAVTDYTIPSNAGLQRPLKVIAPPGTVVNPTFPAACSTGSASDTSQRLADLLMACFAQAVPRHVVAGSYASAALAMWTGRDPIEWRRRVLGREQVVVMDNIPGGFGGRPDKDGINGIKVHTGNALVTPVEVVEYNAPIRIRRWEILPDTGGAGRFRGGCAAVREFEVLFDDTLVTTQMERTRIPPFGLFGGRPGATGAIVLNQGRPNERRMGPKNPPMVVGGGDVLTFQPAGAGGYGDPLERPAADVLSDVLDGYVGVTAARREYGVVLDESGHAVDALATTAERERLRATRPPLAPIDRGHVSASMGSDVRDASVTRHANEAESTTFVVEPFQAQRFAHAVGDLDPIYFDAAAARAAGLPGTAAPPTFVASLHVWDIGSLEADLRVDGVDPRRFPGPIQRDAALLGGGQELDFIRPVRQGETLVARTRVVDHHVRETRGGPLTFVVTETRYTDLDGGSVLLARDTVIARQPVSPDATKPQR